MKIKIVFLLILLFILFGFLVRGQNIDTSKTYYPETNTVEIEKNDEFLRKITLTKYERNTVENVLEFEIETFGEVFDLNKDTELNHLIEQMYGSGKIKRFDRLIKYQKPVYRWIIDYIDEDYNCGIGNLSREFHLFLDQLQYSHCLK